MMPNEKDGRQVKQHICWRRGVVHEYNPDGGCFVCEAVDALVDALVDIGDLNPIVLPPLAGPNVPDAPAEEWFERQNDAEEKDAGDKMS
jgi:hypothetical protein